MESSKISAYGFLLTLFFGLVYFLWENGPHHASHKREALYMFFVIFLLGASTVAMDGMSVWEDGKTEQQRATIIFEYIAIFYVTIHVFISSIPQTPNELEGVTEEEFKVSYAILRSGRDIENLIDQVDASGRKAFKKMAMGDAFVAPAALLFGIIHTLMVNNEDFASKMLIVLYVIGFIFFAFLLKTFLVALFVNSKLKWKLHAKLEKFGKTKNAMNFLLQRTNAAVFIENAPLKTVQLICHTSLPYLNVKSKAILVDALQKRGGLVYNVERAKELERLFLSCKGEDCTMIKNLTDLGGDYQNLYKLIYSDIGNEDIRANILAHFKTEAENLIAKNLKNGTAGVAGERNGYVGVKILSDVDDTLYSSGGHFPAGCDKEYPKHQLYPGCTQFFASLDYQAKDESDMCNLVFLSARPHAYKDLAEHHSYQLFDGLVKQQKMHAMPTLLPGRVKQGVKAIFGYAYKKNLAWEAVGELKFVTFEAYANLYPEYKFIFCGDDGQGDLLAGEYMAEKHSDKLLAVFIHRVVDRGRSLCQQSLSKKGSKHLEGASSWEAQIEAWEAKNIYVTETYVHSASVACTLGLITPEALCEVGEAALIEFDEIRCSYPSRRVSWEEAEKDLAMDVITANAVLEKCGTFKNRINSVTTTESLFSSDAEVSNRRGSLIKTSSNKSTNSI